MKKTKFRSSEEQARYAEVRPKKSIVITVSVFAIPNYGVENVLEMPSDLMFSARFWLDR